MFDFLHRRKNRAHWALYKHSTFDEVLCSHCGYEAGTEEMDGEMGFVLERRCPSCGCVMVNWCDPHWL